MRLLLLIALFVATASGHAGLLRDRHPDANALTAGTHTLRMTHDGRTRQYIVHVPPGYDAGKPAPLVIAFHGGGGHAAWMADDRRYGLISAADRDGYVVVFPNGYSKLRRGRFATWNAGGCCGDARDRDSDDVGFTRALVARMQQQLNIDPQRIYAVGMSNGGMMAHRLACDAADLFSGVASVAGTDATLTCNPSRAISVLHIHAQDDTHVLFKGGAGKDAFRDSAKVMNFVSVPETMARWTRRNQCEENPQRTLQTDGAWCDTWSHCANGSRVQLCVTADGGHSWPGAARVRAGKQPASQSLDANATFWQFFSR